MESGGENRSRAGIPLNSRWMHIDKELLRLLFCLDSYNAYKGQG